MVVPLILLGAATKLAFAVAITHRTRTWWVPGTYAVGLGTLATLHAGPTRTVGTVSVVLGALALAVGHRLRQRHVARAAAAVV